MTDTTPSRDPVATDSQFATRATQQTACSTSELRSNAASSSPSRVSQSPNAENPVPGDSTAETTSTRPQPTASLTRPATHIPGDRLVTIAILHQSRRPDFGADANHGTRG